MFGRKVRSHLNTLRPDLARKVGLINDRNKDKSVMLDGETLRLVKRCMPETMDQETWLPGKVTGIQGSALHRMAEVFATTHISYGLE